MKASLTNQEIVNTFRHLTNLKFSGTPKCTYVLAKNRAALKPVVDKLEKMEQEGMDQERVKAYQTALDVILKQFTTDDKGIPIVQDLGQGRYQRVVPAAKQGEFMVAREALDKEYADLHLASDLHQRSMAEFLKEETEVDLRTLDSGELPKEIQQADMNMLYLFVKDPEGESELEAESKPTIH